MKKVKYIIKKLKSLQWKNLFAIVKKIHKITKKNSLLIFFDIVYSTIKYGTGYMDYFEFEFYLLSKKERSTYLTSSINNQIIAKYNDKEWINYFADKVLFNQTFEKYLKREFLDIRDCTIKDFQKFTKRYSKFIAKPLDNCGGKGIEIYNTLEVEMRDIWQELHDKKQYLLEELIIQDGKMNELYAGSINSLRIITFLTDKSEVIILNAVLRIGNNGFVDNFSSGGMYTFLNEHGQVIAPAIDEVGNIYKKHPVSDTKIVGFQVPFYNEVVKLLQEAAQKIPQVRYIGWDVAISEKGPVLIEGNEYSGVFQLKPSLSENKEGLLPTYQKYLDI